MERRRERLGHAAAIAILLAVPFVFLWQMTVAGWEPLAPDTQAVQPLGVWATQARAQTGHTPQWCPAIFSGMPSYGSFIHTPSSTLDPLRAARQLFPENRGMRYFLALAVGGVALYLLLLRWRRSALGALAGALTFVLTPYMLGMVAAGHSTKLQALYLAPPVFLAIQVLLDRRTLAAAGFLAAAVALQFWSNHPQISYYTLLLGGLYFALTLIFDRPARWRGRAWVAGVALAALALALAAGLVLDPYAAVLEYTPHSIRGGTGELAGEGEGGGGTGWAYATAWSYPVAGVIEFLFPAWFGLEGSTYWGGLPFTQSTHYFGISALLLAIAGVALSRERRRWILLALAGFVLVAAFGRNLPILYGPMYHLLPMFNRFRIPSMILALLPLVLAGLVAAGLDRLADGAEAGARGRAERPRGGRGRDGWLTFAAAATGALVLWLLIGSAVAQGMRGAGAFLKDGELGRVPAGLLGQLTRERIDLFRRSVALGIALLAVGAWLIAARRRGILRGALAGGLLLLWLGADLWITGRRFYDPRPRTETEAGLQADEVVRFLRSQERPFRIAPFQAGEFGSNRYAAFGLETVGGYQPAKLRIYHDLIASGTIAASPVLSMLNAEYLIADRSLAESGWPLAATVQGSAGAPVYIHRTPGVMPRAWFVPEARLVDDAREMLDLLERFDPARTAAFYRREVGLFPSAFSAGRIVPLDAEGGLQGFRVTPEQIALPVEVDGPQPGLLVLSEIYYAPGWRAEIDGQPAPILRANHVLRAVAVPPGRHLVRFAAVAPALARGTWISRACALAVAGLLAFGLVSRWRGRRTERPAPAP